MKKNRALTAFTLIELLVVIAIIVILAALALPSYRTVMENSRTAKCADNLRQIGSAMFLFSSDHNQLFPESGGAVAWNSTDGTTGQASWMQQLAPYLSNAGDPASGAAGGGNVFTCPSSSMLSQAYPADKYYSYFNGAHAAYAYAVQGDDQQASQQANKYPAVRRTLIAHPSEQILSGDITNWVSSGVTDADKVDYTVNPIQSVSTFHNGQINLLFADGHVEQEHWNPNLSPPGFFDATRMTTHYDGTGPVGGGSYYQYLTP